MRMAKKRIIPAADVDGCPLRSLIGGITRHVRLVDTTGGSYALSGFSSTKDTGEVLAPRWRAVVYDHSLERLGMPTDSFEHAFGPAFNNAALLVIREAHMARYGIADAYAIDRGMACVHEGNVDKNGYIWRAYMPFDAVMRRASGMRLLRAAYFTRHTVWMSGIRLDESHVITSPGPFSTHHTNALTRALCARATPAMPVISRKVVVVDAPVGAAPYMSVS